MKDIEGQCIQVTLNYHPGIAPTNASATPVFRGISLENIRCDSAQSSYLLDGLAEQHIEGLRLHNVTMGRGVGKEAGCTFTDCTCTDVSPCPTCCRLVAAGERQ